VIAVDEAGTGDALVLLHGVGASRGVWRRVLPRLARRHRVLAPDLPGFGGSDPAGDGFDLDAVADALAAGLADRCDVPFALVGNSLGGAVAVVLAARRPDLVRRLVLAAPAGFGPHRAPLARAGGIAGARLIGLRRRVGAPLAGSATARRVLLFGTVGAPADLPAGEARAMLTASRDSARIGPAIAAVMAADLRPRLSTLTVPCGAIWGERDRVVPIATLDALRACVARLPVERIAGAGHVPQVERPEAFAVALERLLDRIAPVTGS
jgi:pimeloyl-ACP methyl ester carboxylesterase